MRPLLKAWHHWFIASLGAMACEIKQGQPLLFSWLVNKHYAVARGAKYTNAVLIIDLRLMKECV